MSIRWDLFNRHLEVISSQNCSVQFFLGEHRTISRIDHLIVHKTSLNKFKKIEIIFSNHSGMKPEKKKSNISKSKSTTVKNEHTPVHRPTTPPSGPGLLPHLSCLPESFLLKKNCALDTECPKVGARKDLSVFPGVSLVCKRLYGHIDFPSQNSSILPAYHFLG